MTDAPDDRRRPYSFRAGTKLAAYVTASHFVDYIQGDLGSGKTVGSCIRVLRHIQDQEASPRTGRRMSRWAMVRNTTPDLKRTTIRTWLNIVPDDPVNRFNWGQTLTHKLRFADIDADVDFFGLDKEEDVRKLRSTEYTGIFFNELPFIEKVLFDEAFGRLRYPAKEDGGATWRGIIGDGNAPDEDHWLALMTKQVPLPPGMPEEEARQYEWPESWGCYMQPPALLAVLDQHNRPTGKYTVNPNAENLENLPAGYYEQQIPGKQLPWIQSRLMNTVALVVDGSPVWPMFRREFHVAREVLQPNLRHEVLVWLDFGRVYPAALFAQEIGQRVYIQDEMLGFNEVASVFAPKIKRKLQHDYPGCTVRLVGDPKGQDKGQAVDISPYDVFRSHGMPVMPAPVKQNNIELRTAAFAHALNDNPAGLPRVVISPKCRTFIIGCAGRYHLVREDDGEMRPKKDRYSNLCDCAGYGFVALGEGRRMIGLSAIGAKGGVQVYKGRKTMRRVTA